MSPINIPRRGAQSCFPPLAPLPTGEGTLFRVVARGPERVYLLLADRHGGTRTLETKRRGDVRECFVAGVVAGQRYAWAVDPSRPLLDPCAVAVAGASEFGAGPPRPGRLWSVVVEPPSPIDWLRPRHDRADSLIYEMHVRGFTGGGTYGDIAARADHLQSLGVTAVELLPVHEFDECEIAKPGLVNFWGYSPIAWNAPMSRYARTDPIAEFRAMTAGLHAAGIEVIVDVVFNHTGEQGAGGPVWHFRDLDPQAYLRHDDGSLLDLTGCGNTVHCADPWMRRMIVDSLRWWVHGLGVDGFRFDLSTIFTRDSAGAIDAAAALVRDIESDPWLTDVHLIAEPWDAGGGHLVSDWPGNERWCVWNDAFRDDVRRAWLESGHTGSTLARRLKGSSDMFESGPSRSVNFITAHDGFTLADVVAYQRKHNEANGEGGRDGRNHEPSANHGVEGPTESPAIRIRRETARRNLIASLFLAQGVPMLVAGDEMGRTQRGNNNAYCHDGELSWVDWKGEAEDAGFLRFVRGMAALRRGSPLLRRNRFLTDADIDWFGPDGADVDWDKGPGQFGYHLHGAETNEADLLVLINLDAMPCGFDLPPDHEWTQLVDTASPSPEDLYDAAEAPLLTEGHIVLDGKSLVVARAARSRPTSRTRSRAEGR